MVRKGLTGCLNAVIPGRCAASNPEPTADAELWINMGFVFSPAGFAGPASPGRMEWRHHAVFDTPQKNGRGPLTMPVTFLRQA